MNRTYFSYPLISILVVCFSWYWSNNYKGTDTQNFTSINGLCSGSLDQLFAHLDTMHETPPLFADMGTHHYPIHTVSREAQLYFDQGLKLVYGFNHAEAIRAFREAIRLDPLAVMPYWGLALALGPNINDWAPSSEREQEAFETTLKALDLAARGTKEADMITALADRYTDTSQVDRSALNEAYRQSMGALAARYPNDVEIQTLFADAIMNTMPWDYYQEDLTPKDGTNTAVATLEKVLRMNNSHPGAHHLYIHIVEASADPDRGVSSAEKLGQLVPAAGHLVHMPAHIYTRVGRYEDAAESNRKAIAADEQYLAACQAQGIYPLGYYPHNIHFLWMAATLSGNKSEALDAAEKVADKIPLTDDLDPNAQNFLSVPLQAYVRFGQWNQILTTPKPDTSLQLVTKYWHYARSIAFCRKHLNAKVKPELAILERALQSHKQDSAMDDFVLMQQRLDSLLYLIPAATFAAHQEDYTKAISLLQKAVAIEDALPYNEPPNWHHPVRQILGSVQMDSGDYTSAIRSFKEDLEWNRNNGWSLFGLAKSLEAQGNTVAADRAFQAFEQAWSYADIQLTATVF